MSKQKIAVLGCTGMLGSAVFRYLSTFPEFEVHGYCRNVQLAE